MRLLRCLLVFVAAALCAWPQSRVTADQVVSFVQDSIRRKQDDGAVAKQVQMLKLTTRLDAEAVANLQHTGAGPKTVAALNKLATDSASLPAAAAAPPKAAAAEPTPPTPAEWKKIIDSIRETGLAYTENLPNFICAQSTERQVDPTGNGAWHKQDHILEKLSYNEHRENYEVVMVNDRVVTGKSHDQLGGATSSGEFGSIMQTIFDPRSGTEFNYSQLVRLGRPNGERIAYRIAFKVSEHLYRIEDNDTKRSVSVGYHGFLWADRETSSVLGIKFDCDDIPADFPIRSVSLDVQYDFVEIAGARYALPFQYDIKSKESRYVSWNEARYANYRKFGADASISFDTPTVPPEKTEEKPIVKKKQ